MLDDDLGDLWDPAPGGAGQNLTYRQGTIVSFNQISGQNTVRVGKATLTDLPLLGVAEAATLTAGATVGIQSIGRQMFIVGRIVRPNTAAYTDAVNRLSNSIVSAEITTSEDTTSTSYTDLATVGPTVPITVKSSGKMLIIVSADIIAPDTGIASGGLMTVEVKDTAGNVIYPAGTLPLLHFMYSDNAAHAVGDSIGATRLFLVNPGGADYIVRAKYAAESGGGLTSFANRNVTCIAL